MWPATFTYLAAKAIPARWKSWLIAFLSCQTFPIKIIARGWQWRTRHVNLPPARNRHDPLTRAQTSACSSSPLLFADHMTWAMTVCWAPSSMIPPRVGPFTSSCVPRTRAAVQLVSELPRLGAWCSSKRKKKKRRGRSTKFVIRCFSPVLACVPALFCWTTHLRLQPDTLCSPIAIDAKRINGLIMMQLCQLQQQPWAFHNSNVRYGFVIYFALSLNSNGWCH